MRSAALGFLIASLVGACGGDDGSTGNPPSGGSGGQAGNTASGGTGGGMSSGGTSPGTGGGPGGDGALRGAASLHVLSPGGCSLTEHYQDFPELASGRPVTETAKVQAVVDGGTTPGGDPAAVVCTWRPVSGVVHVDGVIRLGPAGSQRFVNLGGVMAQGETYESGIALAGPELPHQYGGMCSYTAIEVDDATRSVWGRLSCGALTSLDMSDTCALGQSYFFFENCTPAD